jgi:hypothetical protein
MLRQLRVMRYSRLGPRAVVRERLYRDAVERAINAAGIVRWVPPPIGGSSHGFRITVPPPGGRSQPTPATEKEDD